MNLEHRFVPYQTQALALRTDRWIALPTVDTSLSSDGQRGSAANGQLLDRSALEAAVELLSSPARVVDFIADLAPRPARDRAAGKERRR
jgi:hypothetical protein